MFLLLNSCKWTLVAPVLRGFNDPPNGTVVYAEVGGYPVESSPPFVGFQDRLNGLRRLAGDLGRD